MSLAWTTADSQNNCSMLSSQLVNGTKAGRGKRYKDVLKSTLKACNIPVDKWQALAQDQLAWRAAICKGTKHFERSRLQSMDDKRSARKNRVPNHSTAVPCQALWQDLRFHFRAPTSYAANTSTDASSSYSKDYYYVRSTKPLRF